MKRGSIVLCSWINTETCGLLKILFILWKQTKSFVLFTCIYLIISLFDWCFMWCSRIFHLNDDNKQYCDRKPGLSLGEPTAIRRMLSRLIMYIQRESQHEEDLNSQQWQQWMTPGSLHKEEIKLIVWTLTVFKGNQLSVVYQIKQIEFACVWFGMHKSQLYCS